MSVTPPAAASLAFLHFPVQIQLRLTRCSINDIIPHSVLKFIHVFPLHACILQHLSYPQVVVVILLTSFLADQTSRSNMSDDDCWDMDGGESAAADSLSSCYLLPSQTFQEVTITVYVHNVCTEEAVEFQSQGRFRHF